MALTLKTSVLIPTSNKPAHTWRKEGIPVEMVKRQVHFTVLLDTNPDREDEHEYVLLCQSAGIHLTLILANHFNTEVIYSRLHLILILYRIQSSPSITIYQVLVIWLVAYFQVSCGSSPCLLCSSSALQSIAYISARWRNLLDLSVQVRSFPRIWLLSSLTDETAITSLYHFYYDVVKGGQYIWKIEEMHKKYGVQVFYAAND